MSQSAVGNDLHERRLSAILAADVAGYSRLMGEDEEGTLAALKGHRRVIVDPAIANHRGRIVKTTGDGMLVEFASAVDAVRCAVDVQRDSAFRLMPGRESAVTAQVVRAGSTGKARIALEALREELTVAADGGLARRHHRRSRGLGCGYDAALGQRCRVAHIPTATVTTTMRSLIASGGRTGRASS
jgi:hypothetical protein